jgi:hypothetical protein
MTGEELDELVGEEQRYTISQAQRRSLSEVGIIDASEGGMPEGSLANQSESLVRTALEGTKRPLISRWGHIVLRRALVSRLDAPGGMGAAEFAALRANVLNSLGEHQVARALVQQVDAGNYNDALRDAAIDAYIGTGDLLGSCPIVRRGDRDARDDTAWLLLREICGAYAGEEARASRDIRRLLSEEKVPVIDGRLAERFAGAAGLGQRAVNIEWEGVGGLTPLRFAMANALGEPVPQGLLDEAGAYYLKASATAPMLTAESRIAGAELAARSGIMSSRAMVDLYSAVFARGNGAGDAVLTAERLRAAYVGEDVSDRLDAIQDVWGGNDAGRYGRMVTTAYAAARLPVSAGQKSAADDLITAMLTAGLDRDAGAWASVVEPGSQGWALLALSQPDQTQQVDVDAFDDFVSQDNSSKQHKSRMLLAGLVALNRIETAQYTEYSEDLALDLTRETAWTRAIDKASEARNSALVVLLAGLGMQGSGWDKMTGLHLYHIVRALERVGLEAEARLIAAEAVARA